jgi:murein DD-endopeptidase MepM/ murein hydrolase activator NlpD
MHELLTDFKVQVRATKKRKQKRRAAAFAKAFIFFACVALSFQFNLARFFGDFANDGAVTEATLAVPASGQISSGGSFSIEPAEQMRDPVFLFRDAVSKSTKNKFEIQFEKSSSAVAQSKGVFYVNDKMMGSSVRLMTALPALPQDFALMGASSVEDRVAIAGYQGGELFAREMPNDPLINTNAGWDGLAVGLQSDAELTAKAKDNQTAALFGSSSATILATENRKEIGREFVIKALFTRDLDSMLREAGVDETSVGLVAEAVARLLNIRQMQPEYLVAFRLDSQKNGGASRAIVQLSLFDTNGLVGSLGLSESSVYSVIEDPWKEEWLTSYSKDSSQSSLSQRFRIMDGIYSAGLRNDIPPHVISETIMQMARAYNIGQFIQSDDQFSIIYSDTTREPGRNDGHVLYASVTHNGETLSCYVLKPSIDGDFTCMTDKDTVTERLGPNGFVVPVNGVLRSGFGPRVHPILGSVRVHEGVDWAAAPGTPVKAAFDGTIEFAGVKGGYGNFIKIGHSNGLGTGYAHLSGFAKEIQVGEIVRSGDVIGFVGSTGFSTGPHLHFELYVAGRAVDPLNFSNDTAQDGQVAEVDKLIQRIIKVESGGSATAKNSLSSATGLGQFIDSTWLRMIRAYRPDIANSMNREDVLSLRFDPSLSREMVYNLATENEADIRKSGHIGTAGNLYLAHFLGSAGAVAVLSAAPDQAIESVVGNGVVAANPFLYGKSTSWTVNWAAKKMNGRDSTRYETQARLPEATRIKNSRFRNYSKAIDDMLTAIKEQRQGS